jgi:hypothetical protein
VSASPPPSHRDGSGPFRIAHLLVLVASTAIAFAIARPQNRGGLIAALSTFNVSWEPWLFLWVYRLGPFPALWSLAVVLISARDDRKRRRAGARFAGIAACYAATAATALSCLVASAFYGLHILANRGIIPGIFSHPIDTHPPPPFGSARIEGIAGVAVLGAWTVMAAGRRWRTEASWLDRLGRVLGLWWIGTFLIYLYGYVG